VIDVKKKLREKEVPHDLAEAEELLKKHQDLKDEILAGRERWVLSHAAKQDGYKKNIIVRNFAVYDWFTKFVCDKLSGNFIIQLITKDPIRPQKFQWCTL